MPQGVSHESRRWMFTAPFEGVHVQILHMCRFCTHLSNGRFDEPQIFSNQGFRRATCRIVRSCLRTMPSGRALCKRRISENNHSRFVGSMSR